MALKPANRWLKAFENFAADLRIKSKNVLSIDERGAPLDMWVSQRRFLQEIGTGLDNGVHVFNCAKSRQLGITTLSVALVDVFWPAMHPNLIGCHVTDTEKNRELNRGMIEAYIDSFPPGYFGDKFTIVKANRTTMQFSNGSRIDFLVAGTRDKGTSWAEGQGYSFAHLTEAAAFGSASGLNSLIEGFSTVNPHRLYVFETTAKGRNHWMKRWYDGLEDITQRSFFIGWWAGDTNRIERKDPLFIKYGLQPPNADERAKIEQVKRLYDWKITQEQLAWIRWKTSQIDSDADREANQPWTAEESFVMSGHSFFQTRAINNDLKKLDEDPPVFKGYKYQVDGSFFQFKLIPMDPEVDDVDDVELKMWEEPQPNGKYAIGFDPAYGRTDHKDGHAIVVLRCFADRVVQVAEYRTDDVEVKYAAWVAFHLCAAYRDCMINVELTGPGRLVMAEFTHLRETLGAEMNAKQTTERGWDDAAAQARWFLYHREDSFGSGFAANYEANFRTKQMMLHNMRGAYVSGEVHLKSRMLLNEMNNVVVDGDNIGAPESANEDAKDDRVFALGLAILAWTNWIRKEMMAHGQTYEAVMAEAGEAQQKVTKNLNNLVRRFLAKADEEVTPEPDWRDEQGLR